MGSEDSTAGPHGQSPEAKEEESCCHLRWQTPAAGKVWNAVAAGSLHELPPALNEMIILLTARHWSQQFEWHIHQPMALKAGVGAAFVAAISERRRPEQMSVDEAIVYDFSTELLRLQNISDGTYARARERFGEPGIIDMVGVAGYYSLLSMMMNTARMAAPADSDVPPLP